MKVGSGLMSDKARPAAGRFWQQQLRRKSEREEGKRAIKGTTDGGSTWRQLEQQWNKSRQRVDTRRGKSEPQEWQLALFGGSN
jgi:hypothetical protein